jgi:hypothetical protein
VSVINDKEMGFTMRTKIFATLLSLLAFVSVAGPASAEGWNFELFAGYYFPEELDEDLSYGLRFGHRGGGNWGWEISGDWFDVADSQGFSGFDVDADIFHADFSLVYYPGGGDFYFFGGPGWATGDIDIPGTTEDASDDVFSLHVGLGYDANVTESFFIPIEARARWYELEGFGPDGGKDNQIAYEASVGLGFRF